MITWLLARFIIIASVNTARQEHAGSGASFSLARKKNGPHARPIRRPCRSRQTYPINNVPYPNNVVAAVVVPSSVGRDHLPLLLLLPHHLKLQNNKKI